MAVKRAVIVGAGDISVVHAEAIAAIDDARLVGVVDVDPAAREAAERAYGVETYASASEMLAKAKPDVVHVATPHDQHVPVTLECLGEGVPVLQEKPIAAHPLDALRLIRAAEAAPVQVGICFQNRYNVSSAELRRLLDAGTLGAINGAFASVVWSRTPGYYETKRWRGSYERAGGGLLINQAIHTLDLLQWFLGDVTAIRGDVDHLRYGGITDVEDTAALLMRHAGGHETAFYGTLTAPQHRPVEIEIDAENAYVTLRNGLAVAWKDGRVEQHAERVANSAGRSYWGVSHELLIRDFYAHLDSGETFWLDPAEAMKSLLILKAAYKASVDGDWLTPAMPVPTPEPSTTNTKE